MHGLPAAIRQRLDQLPHRAPILRYALTLGIVGVITLVVHRSPLTEMARGVIAISVVLLCAWFGGLGPALLLTPLLLLIARLVRDEPDRWAAMNSDDVMGLTVMTLICSSIGLAGQYRRRIRAVTEQHAQKLQDQALRFESSPDRVPRRRRTDNGMACGDRASVWMVKRGRYWTTAARTSANSLPPRCGPNQGRASQHRRVARRSNSAS